ncbi:MAG: hypothetical protein IIB45_10015 [Candidatus Marinimicrobia bacterium]|nr:hypothetical protein [Candidatus Neomarinimicrobiota bacterium]
MHLKIKPFNTTARELYKNHGHFHDGDAGIDLFIINEQTIKAGEKAFIHLQISCNHFSFTAHQLFSPFSLTQRKRLQKKQSL